MTDPVAVELLGEWGHWGTHVMSPVKLLGVVGSLGYLMCPVKLLGVVGSLGYLMCPVKLLGYSEVTGVCDVSSETTGVVGSLGYLMCP